ncbi:MAG: proline--tRNA ligase, partial [Candidatus Omnitrophica bacterium CG12_big_fil_rev_8_21_14_0_65_50_5]
IFQLGTKYSDALQAHVLHEDGKKYPILMGCYGIGVSRVIAAVIETHHDDKGIQWPKEVAPFDIEIIPLAKSKDECAIWDLAEKYYRELTQAGFDVLMDDREESAGRKFNDADLIGIPQRIVIGQKNLSDGNVEIKNRATGEVHIIGKDDVLKFFKP